MHANPWKDPLYQLIAEYGGLSIPRAEREEWREVLPLGLRRKPGAGVRDPGYFVQAALEDGQLQAFGIQDTRDLHDALTIRLPTHRMGAGLRLRTERDVDADEAGESAFMRQLREVSTVIGDVVPRGRSHRVTVYETSPVLWERSDVSRSRRAGVAVNPFRWPTPRNMTAAEMAPINRYLNLIRNKAKRDYGNNYMAWLRGGAVGYPPERGKLSVMGAQAVRVQLESMLTTPNPKRQPAVNPKAPRWHIAIYSPEGHLQTTIGRYSSEIDAQLGAQRKKEELDRRGWAYTVRVERNPKRRPAVQYEAFKTRDIVPFVLPKRIPARMDQTEDLLAGFRPPKPEKQMRMFNAKIGPYAFQCKLHDYQHPYAVCPKCRHQYCSKYWPACPHCHSVKPKVNPSAQHSPVWRKGFQAGIAAKARGAVQSNPLTRRETADELKSLRMWKHTALKAGVPMTGRRYAAGRHDEAAFALERFGAQRRKTLGRLDRRVNPRIVGRAGKGLVFRGSLAQASAYAQAHGLSAPVAVGIRKGARI